MEVPGRREMNNFLCKSCEESNIVTPANGFCDICEEYICTSCFETHAKWKLNRDHTLLDLNKDIKRRESSKEFEKCEQHLNEPVKFYCGQHEQVGCGDCMIIDHRSCKVEYILDKAKDIKGITKFDAMTKGLEQYKIKAERLLSSIKNNMVQVDDINEKFKQDVNQFHEEIISKVNNLRDCLLKGGESIKANDSLSMKKLADETESLIRDINDVSDLFESKVKSPSQLFACSVSQKPRLDLLMKQLNDIKSKNKIENYEFERDTELARTLSKTDQEENKEEHISTTLKASDLSASQTVAQPLLDNQLICRGMQVDGEYLSYVDNGNGNVGIYVDKNEMMDGRYFEIEILSLGRRGTIALGLVPNNYPANMQPGWGQNSIGYHADDGRLYFEFGRGRPFGPKYSVDDKIGCYIMQDCYLRLGNKPIPDKPALTAVFTRNCKKVGERELNLPVGLKLFAAVGMHSPGEKVKVLQSVRWS